MNPRLPRPRHAFRPTHLMQRRLRALGFAEKHEWMTNNLGKELGSIDHELLEPCGTPVTSAGGFELLCSYNWRRQTRGGLPQIYVPGEAPHLVPHNLPVVTRLHPKGKNFRDVNAALLPAFPFEPMFRAVALMRPEFRFDDVDLVINRSSLHHLLRLADEGRCKDAFRLDLAMVHNTLIVTPLWKSISDKGNYGRIFEEYFTRYKQHLAQSQSHHRAIQYDLGPLKIAILCEVDATCQKLSIPPSWTLSPNQTVEAMTPKAVSALKKALSLQTSAEIALFAAIRRPKSAGKTDVELNSRVVHVGRGTPSQYTAEMTTMARPGKRDKAPQMWLGRTPYLIQSQHLENTFTDVNVTHCGPHLQDFEQTNQGALQKLVTVIKMLAQFTVSASRSRHAIAVCTKDERTLRVFEAADKPESPVPLEIRQRFWSSNKMRGEMSSQKPSSAGGRVKEGGPCVRAG